MDGTADESSAARPANHLLRSSVVVAAGTGLSRLTGFLRLAVMAWAIGTTALAEAYNLANNTPNLLYDLVLGGILSATLVPVVVDHMRKEDSDGISALASVITLILVATTIVGMLLAPLIIALFNLSAPAGQGAEQAKIAVPLLIMFAPQILFYGLTSLGTALLNAKRSFAVAAFAPVLNNIIVICMFLALPHLATNNNLTFEEVRTDNWLLLLLGLGTTAGIVAMTTVLWPAMRSVGIRLRWNPDFKHPAVREIGRLSVWTLGYVLTNLASYFVIQTLANGVDGITIYAYAWLFFQLPYGLWTVSVMTSYTPELASLHAAGNIEGLRHRFGTGLRLVLLVAVPATIGMILLAGPLVRVVLSRGQFSAEAADTTANTLIAFTLGLPGFSVFLFAMRGFYSQRDTRTPFFINFTESVIAVIIALFVVTRFEVVGLGASGSISYAIFAAVALGLLHRRIGPFLDRKTITTILRIVLASMVMGIVVWLFVAVVNLSDITMLSIGAAIGAVVYLVMLLLLRVDETRQIVKRLRRN